MRNIFLNFLLLFVLVSCSDSAKVRQNKPAKNDIPLSHADEPFITSDFEFSKLFIAEIFVPYTIKNNFLTLNETMTDVDSDGVHSCSVQVASGTQFQFLATDYKLKLSNQNGTMDFVKTDGFMGEGIHGTWEMNEKVNFDQIITEIEFSNSFYMRLRKTCKIK